MSDQKNNPQKIIGSYIDETDEKYLELKKDELEKLKQLPERRDENIWDKI